MNLNLDSNAAARTWSHSAQEESVQRQMREAAMQQQAGEKPPRLTRCQHCKAQTNKRHDNQSQVELGALSAST
jgi:uncharacterized protein with PIN domain